MTVDNNDNPIVATYWAPGTTGSTNSTLPPNGTTNNPNRQYMLVYYDGTQWRTSQISERTSDTAFDTIRRRRPRFGPADCFDRQAKPHAGRHPL